MKTTFRLTLILLCFAFFPVPRNGNAQSVEVLLPDVAINFSCDERTDLEVEIEEFLVGNNYKALNLARIQREGGVYAYELHLVAIDTEGRILEFIGLSKLAGIYSVTLNTRPPTRRSGSEKTVEQFVSGALGCKILNISRGENRAEALDLHNREVNRIEDLFRKSQKLDGA